MQPDLDTHREVSNCHTPTLARGLLISMFGVTRARNRQTACDRIREASGATAICLLGPSGDNVAIVVAAGDDALARGFDSGRIIRAVAGIVGGGGGGKPGLAQGKGRDPSKVNEALATFLEEAKKTLASR